MPHKESQTIHPTQQLLGSALSDEHIDHAVYCMMAYAPLSDADAAPIFRPYLDGLALMAKSDVLYNFDDAARSAFVTSLAAALRKYGDWNGEDADFEKSCHKAFSHFIPDVEHRNQMFTCLKREGDIKETSFANMRSSKQLADLFLVHTARRIWPKILDEMK